MAANLSRGADNSCQLTVCLSFNVALESVFSCFEASESVLGQGGARRFVRPPPRVTICGGGGDVSRRQARAAEKLEQIVGRD